MEEIEKELKGADSFVPNGDSVPNDGITLYLCEFLFDFCILNCNQLVKLERSNRTLTAQIWLSGC